ncbi:hypothetical protein [Fulvivirga lutea]|uniref:Phage abortive infection protein n=1 Tax=Fulvivirga lutea TaxID=2810512 RepID=A0A974WED4_9BACT|nr:hypothetical protein [Fulvivirga lutea]QSE96511.1 hypothetical protein JR347_12990 [Fulvivirga lutea]
MKKFFLKYIFPISAGVILTFIPIVLLTKLKFFPLGSESATIGSAIGGITAPFVGLIGAFLIYYTFRKQQESIESQDRFQYVEFLLDVIKELKSSFISFTDNAGTDIHGKVRTNEFQLNYFLSIINQYQNLANTMLSADIADNHRRLVLQDLFMWYISNLQILVNRTQEFRIQEGGRIIVNPILDDSFQGSFDSVMAVNMRVSEYLRN